MFCCFWFSGKQRIFSCCKIQFHVYFSSHAAHSKAESTRLLFYLHFKPTNSPHTKHTHAHEVKQAPFGRRNLFRVCAFPGWDSTHTHTVSSTHVPGKQQQLECWRHLEIMTQERPANDTGKRHYNSLCRVAQQPYGPIHIKIQRTPAIAENSLVRVKRISFQDV